MLCVNGWPQDNAKGLTIKCLYHNHLIKNNKKVFVFSMIVFIFAVPKYNSDRPAVENRHFALCMVAAVETPARQLL